MGGGRRSGLFEEIGCGWRLDADYIAKFFYGSSALFQCRIFIGREFDLDDLLEAASAQLAGNADVVAIDTVFTLEKGRAGKDLLLVLEDGFDHFRCSCGGRVVG